MCWGLVLGWLSGSGRLQFSPGREEQGTGAAGTVEVLKVPEQDGSETRG